MAPELAVTGTGTAAADGIATVVAKSIKNATGATVTHGTDMAAAIVTATGIVTGTKV